MGLLIVACVAAFCATPFVALGIAARRGHPALGWLLGLLGPLGIVVARGLPRTTPLAGAGRGKHKAPVAASMLTTTGRLGRHRPWPHMEHRPRHRRR